MLEKFKGKTNKLTDISAEKLNQLLDDFNSAIPTMNALGLSIKDFNMKMAVIPEIEAKLIGSLDAVDPEKIEEIVSKNPDKKMLIGILKGLQTASLAKNRISGLSLGGIEVDIKLGLPPSVKVGFC